MRGAHTGAALTLRAASSTMRRLANTLSTPVLGVTSGVCHKSKSELNMHEVTGWDAARGAGTGAGERTAHSTCGHWHIPKPRFTLADFSPRAASSTILRLSRILSTLKDAAESSV